MNKIMASIVRALPHVFQVLGFSLLVSVFVHVIFIGGYLYGYGQGVSALQKQVEDLLSEQPTVSSTVPNEPIATPTPRTVIVEPQNNITNWSGPQLWEAVNAKRQSLGVSTLSNQSELCTIASIRLNELLELGKLDGHEGFSTLAERRPDLKWIFEKYNISEFLVSGATSAEEAVNLWENTLGHKKLLTGGEYVWGCTYAQNTFGVAIAAY